MKCPLCQSPNAAGAKFCSECGCDLRTPTEVLPVFPQATTLPVVPQVPLAADGATLSFDDGPQGQQASTLPIGGAPAEEAGSVAYTAAQMFGGTREMPAVGEPDTSGTERFASPFAASAAPGIRLILSSEANFSQPYSLLLARFPIWGSAIVRCLATPMIYLRH